MIEPKIKFQTIKNHNLTEQELEKATNFIQEKSFIKEEKVVEMKTDKETINSQETISIESKKKSKKRKQ